MPTHHRAPKPSTLLSTRAFSWQADFISFSSLLQSFSHLEAWIIVSCIHSLSQQLLLLDTLHRVCYNYWLLCRRQETLSPKNSPLRNAYVVSKAYFVVPFRRVINTACELPGFFHFCVFLPSLSLLNRTGSGRARGRVEDGGRFRDRMWIRNASFIHCSKLKMGISHFNVTNLTQPCQNAAPPFFPSILQWQDQMLTKRHVDLHDSTVNDSPKQEIR